MPDRCCVWNCASRATRLRSTSIRFPHFTSFFVYSEYPYTVIARFHIRASDIAAPMYNVILYYNSVKRIKMYMYIQSNGMPRGLAQFGDGVQLSLCACSGTQNLRSLQNSDVHALPHCASKIARTAGTTLSVGHKPGMLTRIRGSRTRTTTRTSIPVINSPQWAKSGTSKNKMPTTISRMVYGEQGSSQGRVAPDRVPLPEDWKDVTLLASVHVWRMTIQSVKLGGDSSKRLNSTGP